MIESILDRTKIESIRLRRKIAPSRFLTISREVELLYRKPVTVASSAQIMSVKERVYLMPIMGYLVKLAISIIKLPVRLRQIYETLDSLQSRHENLQRQVSESEKKYQQAHFLFDKHHEAMASIAVLQELNHKVYTRTEQFEAHITEKLQRVMEHSAALETRLNRNLNPAIPAQHNQAQDPISSAFYAAFERRFRAPSENLQAHLRNYISCLAPSDKPQKAVDLGCGRGEWLKILKASGYQITGVDINATTNSSMDDESIQVVESDALSYLEKMPRSSLDVISSFHLIEHLEPGYLINLIQQAFRSLKPGGTLILETPNPENIVVGACNFHMDPTHKRPIPPAALGFMVEYAGFEAIECRRFHPNLPPYEGIDEHVKAMSHFFAVGQDYSIIAKKPHETKVHQ